MLKNLIFEIDDAEHARLRIQLKYDKLQQKEFYKMVVNSYINHDPDFMDYIDKKVKAKLAKITQKKKKKQRKIEETIKQDFALDENEIKDIFDIIAAEDPDI